MLSSAIPRMRASSPATCLRSASVRQRNSEDDVSVRTMWASRGRERRSFRRPPCFGEDPPLFKRANQWGTDFVLPDFLALRETRTGQTCDRWGFLRRRWMKTKLPGTPRFQAPSIPSVASLCLGYERTWPMIYCILCLCYHILSFVVDLCG